MPTDYIKIIYDSEGFNKAVNEQLALGKSYVTTSQSLEKFNKVTQKTSTSADRLITRMGKLSSFGRDLRQAGGFLGNDTLMALGSFADGMGDVAQSIDAVSKSQSKLGKIIGIGGSILGGIGLGTQIYDATIGKAQGTDTGTILKQVGQFIEAGFNQEQLAKNLASELSNMRFQVESAQINANNAIFDFKQAAAKNPEAGNRALSTLFGGLGDIFGPLGGRFNKLSTGAGDVASKQASDTFAKSLTEAMQRMGGMGQAFGSLQAASQLAGGRQAQARSLYSQSLKLIEQDVSAKRLELAKSYSAQTLEADRQYYAQRAELARNYGVETQRAEEDHQRNIRRLSQDHQKRLKKLVESRDALAVEDEVEAYKDERQRADEDYQVAARRRSEDYANQLRQMEQAHREQEQQRRAAYNQQLVDLQTYAQLRRNQEAVEYGNLLRDIVEAFTKARNEFAASISNSNNVTTNKTANVTTNITGPSGGISLPLIEQTVYGAIEKAMR